MLDHIWLTIGAIGILLMVCSFFLMVRTDRFTNRRLVVFYLGSLLVSASTIVGFVYFLFTLVR